MWFALEKGLVDTRGLGFRHEIQPLEVLNRGTSDGRWDLAVLSFHAYAYAADRYRMTTAGAVVGDGYGPLVVSRRSLTSFDLDESVVAVPGDRTTACLALRLFCPGVEIRNLPADRIAEEVAKGNIDAGLIMHEGKVRNPDLPLKRVVDLGEWWRMETGFPLPLAGCAVRRDIEHGIACDCAEVLRDSVRYAMDHPREALEHANSFSGGIDPARTAWVVETYVNTYSVELGERGEQAVELLLRLGHEKGLIPRRVVPEFID